MSAYPQDGGDQGPSQNLTKTMDAGARSGMHDGSSSSQPAATLDLTMWRIRMLQGRRGTCVGLTEQEPGAGCHSGNVPAQEPMGKKGSPCKESQGRALNKWRVNG